MKEKLIKFITENHLDFSGTGSSLNGAMTVICGYADYVSASKKVVGEAIKEFESQVALTPLQESELNRIYKFASTYNYGKWWNSVEAQKMYKF